MRNLKDRERRAKRTVHDLLEDLKGKNLINEELKERLNFYSGNFMHILCVHFPNIMTIIIIVIIIISIIIVKTLSLL